MRHPSCFVPPVLALVLATVALGQNLGATFVSTVDSGIEVPYSPDLTPQSGITVEAWITYDDATLPAGWRYPTIARQGVNGNGSENWFLRINANNTNTKQLRWKIRTATNEVAVNWPFTAGQLNTWTHVAGTYDGAFARLFVNGVQVAQAPGNGAPIRHVPNELMRIGKGTDEAVPSIEVWNGELDEVRLWPFARTQAEIQSTMNHELVGVPGRVSTWILNGVPVDFSGGQHGTEIGTVNYTANPLPLASSAMGTAVGSSTPGCLGDLLLSQTSITPAGNTAFALACTRPSPGAIGLWVGAFAPLPFSVPVFGIDFWLDPTYLELYVSVADGLGTLRLGLPVPATAPIGASMTFQSLVLDACGSEGWAASNALVLAVQP